MRFLAYYDSKSMRISAFLLFFLWCLGIYDYLCTIKIIERWQKEYSDARSMSKC